MITENPAKFHLETSIMFSVRGTTTSNCTTTSNFEPYSIGKKGMGFQKPMYIKIVPFDLLFCFSYYIHLFMIFNSKK